MRVPRPLQRTWTAFMEGPATARSAMRVIVTATVVATFLGGTLVWVFDHKEFLTFGDAMWWSLQTVTTVGYGDITPKQWVGRVIGAGVLVYSVAFLSVLTATITTSFLERSRPRAGEGDPVRDRLDEIASRLEHLERLEEERRSRDDGSA